MEAAPAPLFDSDSLIPYDALTARPLLLLLSPLFPCLSSPERPSPSLPAQNSLPLFTEYDKQSLEALAASGDVDFVSLSYTRSGKDVREARAFLDSIGLKDTKILAKVRGGRVGRGLHAQWQGERQGGQGAVRCT